MWVRISVFIGAGTSRPKGAGPQRPPEFFGTSYMQYEKQHQILRGDQTTREAEKIYTVGHKR